MVNNVIGMVNYVIAARPSLLNFMIADTEAIRTAAGALRDLRVAEVVKQDIHLDEGGAITYRTKLQLSFKYEVEH